MKFIYEEEKEEEQENVEGKLIILDLSLIRNGRKLEYDIYRKPSTTDRYITSDAYQPFEHKIATIDEY